MFTGQIGITLDVSWPEPETDSQEDQEASEMAMQFYVSHNSVPAFDFLLIIFEFLCHRFAKSYNVKDVINPKEPMINSSLVRKKGN